ncbi:MAG: beta-ketoacyl-ACP synthase II [Deltaproteobacteria bacterium]|nr:beta-ketoacyl-ACP synthase II [Deltaproteobacteria bacterium]MBN2671316.1 beta-ketoacyl-ACP synthase II [Deltaproteobacteria bacterium]
MRDKRRVVITGLGAVSPLGLDVESLWAGLVAGKSGIDYITHFDTEHFATKIAGEVKGFDPLNYVSKREVRQMDRFIQLAVAAADEAMKDSGLTVTDELAPRVASIFGVGVGGLESMEITYEKMMELGTPKRITPYFIPMMISNLAPGHISMRHNLKGPSYTVTSACASATHAAGDAFRMIQDGTVDVAVTGGAEAAITSLGIGGFNAIKALSTRNDEPQKASRPFEKDRDGFIMGEGAGVVVMEELEHAKARGAKIYAEMTGYGASADANHITQPAPGGEGAIRCMNLCIKDAGIQPSDVDYVNAHGTSTPINDPLETEAMIGVFGEHANTIAVSSTKSMTGHLLGAAGAIEAIALAKAIEKQIAPPTINMETPDERCTLDYIPNTAREMKIVNAMSNSLGFGGTNATIMFAKYEG